MHYKLLFLALSLPWAPLSPALAQRTGEATVKTVKESATKVEFAVTMEPAKDTKLALAGTAVRDKRVFLNFEVYAYGLYVDQAAAAKTLAAWKGKTTKQLEGDNKFYAELCKDNFAKSLHLKFVREVDGEDVEEAFTDSIQPRIKSARKKRDLPDATQQLAAFKTFFETETFKKGDEIILTWLPGNKLVAKVKGKTKPTIVSPALCWALFDVYLGERPIESKGRKTVIGRMPALLR